ncbi:MAG: malate dehydrogenase [Candidatus Omnitrophota bacterium]
MKISIIGAGSVGSATAMRLAQENLGEIILIDVIKGLAQGKAFDLEDARSTLKIPYNIQGSNDINSIKGSDIAVITAGLPRKPGMTREDLVSKNAQILKDLCENIKKLTPESIVIVVTNPLDLMTYFALTITGFKSTKVIGMGVSLDAARFANLISKELNIPVSDIEASVIGTHGQGMIPLTRFSTIKGVGLEEFLDDKKDQALAEKTVNRGAEIVALLGNGSAFFAPSAAISALVKCIAKDEKRTIGVCTYLDGEYGINDICVGVPCRIGREGIEKIIELELNETELGALRKSAEAVRKSIELLPL